MTEVTSRARVRDVIEGRRPDRVPFNFWMDRDRMAQLDSELGDDFRISHFRVDVVEVFPGFAYFPQLHAKTVSDSRTTWVTAPAMESIAVAADLEMPDTEATGIEDYLAGCRAKYPDKALFGLILTPLEMLFGLRRMENALMDIYDEPKAVHAFLERLSIAQARLVERAAACDIDVIYLAGDICASKGPIISPKHLSEFGFSYMQPLVDAAHRAGKPVFYHTDGRIMDIIGLFDTAGVEGLNPIQPHLNDLREFSRGWGERFMVYGALDNCYVIPDSSPDGVREHVRQTFDTLGEGRGLIFSTHDIPGYTQLENVVAMVEEIERCSY